MIKGPSIFLEVAGSKNKGGGEGKKSWKFHGSVKEIKQSLIAGCDKK